jgi:hypothetical protein
METVIWRFVIFVVGYTMATARLYNRDLDKMGEQEARRRRTTLWFMGGFAYLCGLLSMI